MRVAVRLAAVCFVGSLAVTAGPGTARSADGDALPPDPAPLLTEARRAEEAGDGAEAVRSLQTALEHYRAREDRIGERQALIHLALIWSRQGRVDEAVDALQEALPLADGAADRTAPVVVRALLVDVLLRGGRPTDALPWGDATLLAAVASEDAELIAPAAHAYLQTTRAIDDSDQTVSAALDHVDGRLAGLPGYAGVDQLAETIYELGAARLADGDVAGAGRALEDAARVAAVTGAAALEAEARFALGLTALQADELGEAREAFSWCAERPGAREVAARTGLAEVALREGWLQEADDHLVQAMDRIDEVGGKQDRAFLAGRRAALAALQGDLEGARLGYEGAARGYAEAGDTAGEVEARARLSQALLRLGRWDEARRQALRSLADNREVFAGAGGTTDYASLPDALTAMGTLSAVALHHGKTDEARGELDRLAAVAWDSGRCEEYAVAAAVRGALILEEEGAGAAAETLLRDVERALGGDCPVWPMRVELGRARERLGDLEGALEAYRQAVEEVEVMSPPPPAAAPALLGVERRAAHDDLIAALIAAGEPEQALAATLRARAWRGGRPLPVDADPLAGLRAGLRGEVDALVVAPLPEQTAIWLVTDDRVIVGSSAVDRAELEALATSLEQALSVAPGEDDETPWDIPSRALYDAVIGPVEEALREHGVTRLAIAADPPLAAVPFAALRDDEQYLVQRMALWSLPPVEVPEGRGTDRSRSRRATLLLAADGWERTEAAARMRYRTTTVVRGEALDRSAWEVALPLADVAVMGLPVEASGVLPTAARLRLVAADGGEDWLRLDGLGASTLSNRLQAWCVPVDPVVAPPLLEAGAGAVLLPSWDAGDEAAAALLTEVFKGLDRVGAGVALQLAQQARIRAGAPPREWAGWSLYEATSP